MLQGACEGLPCAAGTVPSSLAALRRLVELNLAANQLTGDLQGFAFMSLDDRDDLNSQMRSLNLSRNRLTGELKHACMHIEGAVPWGCS